MWVEKGMSEVGFEPTPTFVDQNTHSATYLQRRFSLESGALDRSAILTASNLVNQFHYKNKKLKSLFHIIACTVNFIASTCKYFD